VIARLRRPAHSKATPAYRVVQQTNPAADAEVCQHRFETLAELCAHWRGYREQETGVFYSALPAVAR
jgi:hypothetical protein